MDEKLKRQAVEALNRALGAELEEIGSLDNPDYILYTGEIKAGPLPFSVIVELGPREGEGVASCYIKVSPRFDAVTQGQTIERTAGGHFTSPGGEWIIGWN